MMRKMCMPLMVALLTVLTSCGSKLGELSPELFTVTPSVLEAVGGEVPVTINGKFPEKYFNKKAQVTVTPVLKWNGGQAVGNSVTFRGEKVESNDQMINYRLGGNYTMKTSFDYVPEMAKSELYLQFVAKVGKKEVNIPAVKVADGVISTSELVGATLRSATPANAEDSFQRVIKQAKEANIRFLIQQANLRASELNSAEMKEFKEAMADIKADEERKILSNVEVTAYASPDGEYGLNERLAGNRESNAAQYVEKQLKKEKLEGYVDTKYTAEDWDGFRELVERSNIQDKDVILRVLSMYTDPERREQEIKNISSVYKTLTDEILPELRRARLTLNYELIGRSDDEIMEAYASSPRVLSVEELLYAATLVDGMSDKEAIYRKTAEIYPNDYRAYNNLAELAYKDGHLETALSYLEKAASINPSAPEVNTNLGLIALSKGDRLSAETYFSKGSGEETLGEALGNLYIAQGQYDRAVSSFANSNTNSAALAQILAKDYNKAKSTLTAVANPDGYTDYLMAIVGARTGNTSLVFSSMAKAVKKDPALAKKALTDLEFAKYVANADFLNALK